jgi:hypothetical protein
MGSTSGTAFTRGCDASTRNTIDDFLAYSGVASSQLLGASAVGDMLGLVGELSVIDASEVDSGGATASVGLWYRAYRTWVKTMYAPGAKPASKYLFSRIVRRLWGLGTRPGSHRGLAKSGRRTRQYRVFCYSPLDSAKMLEDVRASRNESAGALIRDVERATGKSSGGGSTYERLMSYGCDLEYPFRGSGTLPVFDVFSSRERHLADMRESMLRDFFGMGERHGSTHSLESLIADRVARYSVHQRSCRIYDWTMVDRGDGHMARGSLGPNRYILEVSVPAKGLDIPSAYDIDHDFTDFSWLRFGIHMEARRDSSGDAVLGEGWLLGFAVSLIEPGVDRGNFKQQMREVIISDSRFCGEPNRCPRVSEDAVRSLFGNDLHLLGSIIDGMRRADVMNGMTAHWMDADGQQSNVVCHMARNWLDGEPMICSGWWMGVEESCVEWGRAQDAIRQAKADAERVRREGEDYINRFYAQNVERYEPDVLTRLADSAERAARGERVELEPWERVLAEANGIHFPK